MSAPSHAGARPAPRGRNLAVLTLGAIGIVYGDIGTSPLYALRECFHGPHGIAATPDNILGVLSLIFWSLTLVVSIKYLTIVMRADNGGEGGVLALMALVSRQADANRKSRARLITLGLFGAALLSGEGMITPAISVLSAVEGLTIATPIFEPYVVPLTLAILIGLFMIQSRGTGLVGAMFGPIMVVWFVTLAALGISWLVLNPHVVVAFNPDYAVRFFSRNGAWLNGTPGSGGGVPLTRGQTYIIAAVLSASSSSSGRADRDSCSRHAIRASLRPVDRRCSRSWRWSN